MTTPGKGRIFISYRRADSAGYAGRIYDRLTAHFGEDAVFMDVDTIEAGVDFVKVLQDAVQSCDVLVALIGRSWLNIKDEAGKCRLDNPEDFVRVEIAAALSRDIRVIPVLVDGAPMPRSTELPDNLMALARRNALQVNHHSFNADARRLISQLEQALEEAEDLRIHIATMSADLEKEEHERKEAAEKARIERDAHEKAEKEAEEKARKAALRKARQQEAVERIKNIFSGGNKRFFYIGGGIVILVLLGYIIRIALTPSTPAPPTETPLTTTLPSATSTKILSTPRPTSTESPTEVPITPTPTSTDLPTEIPPTPTPKFGIGDTMISENNRMVMVYVPAGEFQMGSENDFNGESPIHTVYLDAFWIDQTEVTNVMYARCVEAGECNPPSSTKSRTHDIYYGNSKFDNYPVINVSWNDATAFCKWAESRLPAEAEWEKAAGWDEDAQAQRVYPWGDKIDHSYANYDQYDGDAVAVGSYEKGVSFYGAYDMAGNVWEWVQDWFDVYPGGDKSASGYLSEYFGQSYRVIRGGAYYYGGGVKSTRRSFDDPSGTSSQTGFRCARDAEP